MKGLIIKDFISICANIRTLIFIITMFAAGSIMSGDITIMSSGLTAVIAVLGINTFSFDEICQWDKFSVALPIKRSKIVMARYIVFLLTCIVGFVISFGISLPVLFVTTMESGGFGESIGATVVSSGTSMLVVGVLFSILIPLIYKYGVQKMRIISMMLIVVPIGVLLILQNFHVQMPTEAEIISALKALPLLAIVLFAASYFVSVRIFAKKEF